MVLVDPDLKITSPSDIMGLEKALIPNLFVVLRDPMVHRILTLPPEEIQPSDSTSQGLLAK